MSLPIVSEELDRVLDNIEKALLVAQRLDQPLLVQLLRMAFWEAASSEISDFGNRNDKYNTYKFR